MAKKWVLEGRIGSGGMGQIYRARQIDLDRPVALKFPNPSELESEESRMRFLAEARACSQLRHPNIVQVYDFSLDEPSPFIAFELIEGCDLREHLETGAVEDAAAFLRLMASVAEGLAAVHEAGIVHRDVKPENILIGADGAPRIVDFGVARVSDPGRVMTETGIILGTPRYMAPEQALGGDLTPATDLYALGVILYEALAGRHPFEAPHDLEILSRHIHDKAPELCNETPDLPTPLCDLVAALLCKDPLSRPSDAAAVGRQLRRLAEQRGTDGPARFPKGMRTTTNAVKAVDDARKTAPCQGAWRNRPRSFAFALSLLFVLAATWWLVSADPAPKASFTSDLKVLHLGSRSVLIGWKASWKDRHFGFRVRRKGIPQDVRITLKNLILRELGHHPKQGERSTRPPRPARALPYEYEALLSGLSQNTAYTISLAKPSAAKKGASFSTLPPRGFHPQVTIGLPGPGAISLVVRGGLPFRCASSPSGETATPFGRLQMQHSFVYRLAKLPKRPVPRLELCSIDGNQRTLRVNLYHLLLSSLRAIGEVHDADWEAGTFLTLFRSPGDKRINKPFHDAAIAMRKLDDRDARKAIQDETYRQVTAVLRRQTRWWPKLAPLLPAFANIPSLPFADGRLRSAWTRARLPLLLLDRASFWYGIPRNDTWARALDPGVHPYPSSYGRPYLAPPVARIGMITGLIASPIEGKIIALLDRRHPTTAKLMGSRGQADFLSLREGSIFLEEKDLLGCKEGEIVLTLRSAYHSVVTCVDINGGAHRAYIEEDLAPWEEFRDYLNRPEVLIKYTDIFAGLGDKESDPTTVVKSILKKLDDALPKLKRCIYQRIPIEALRLGHNVIKIHVRQAPIRDTEYVAFLDLALRLKGAACQTYRK